MTRPASSFSALFTSFTRSHELTADIRGAWHESSDPFTALHTSSQLSQGPATCGPQYQRVTEATQSEINPEGADPDTAPLPSHLYHATRLGELPASDRQLRSVAQRRIVKQLGHTAHSNQMDNFWSSP